MALYDSLNKSDNPKRTFDEVLTYTSRKRRYLLRALLELSPICNFTCPFCYVRRSSKDLLEEGKSVLRFSYWKGILDQLFEMGVLYVGFTGGECMLHPDFIEIYEYAAQKGFFIYLISNGSCLTDSIFDTFRKYPPTNINITVYGGSEETYQKVCGKGVYYNIVKNNLRRLSEAHISVSVQMTVSKDNVRDVYEVYELCKRLNIRFGCGNTLISCERCTEEIQAVNRVSDEEYRDMMRLLHHIENRGRTSSPMSVAPKSNISGITCSAGRSSAFINHEGMMLLCVSYQEVRISTFEHSLIECWKEVVNAADKIPHIEECNGCIHSARCVQCFGAHYYDTGSFTTPSPNLCFKRKHPGEAARIEAYYDEHGVLPPVEF